MSQSPAPTSAPSAFLRWSALAVGVLVVVQTILAVFVIMKNHEIREVHGIVGLLTLLAAIVATIAAGLSMRRTGDKGIVMHAGGVAVLTLIQYGLGEAKIEMVHMGLGVLILLGGVALAVMAWRRRTPTRSDDPRDVGSGATDAR